MNDLNEALLNGYIITEEKIEKIKKLNNVPKRGSLGEKGFLWYHLNVGTEETKIWLKNKSGLSEIVIQELISEETRPRILKDDDGILINLRGLNFNADSDEEDMVSLHMCIEPGRIITSRSERVLTMDDIDKSYAAGAGPLSINDFLIRVIDGITNKISEYIYDIEEQIDDMEEEVLTGETGRLRSELSEKRRETIIIRRYIVPQRELMARL